MGTFENAEQFADEMYERKCAADPMREETLAMCWFTDEANRRVEQLKNCVRFAPSAGQLFTEASCFAATLSDLCLWANRAQSGRMSWVKAKAAYERMEADAQAPVLPDLDPDFDAIDASLDRLLETARAET